ncbi:hypothetical protein [Stakelama saccharophila]|uniref:Argininosuccinate lyase n=1 Tax=Stakelama saccharophila TaxID=3075605 RepID=A0ABZ0B8K0_9SPHN|nr:hypothetical protein [Stakelama sp. W311]WNO53713.1 hypothetical protein RPR59_00120 [Stakelama sp. W311]
MRPMTFPRLCFAAGALALSACGAKNALEPPEGQPLPPPPYGAEEAPTASNLLSPAPEMRPQRSDELLKDSREREPDPFDLPPEG